MLVRELETKIDQLEQAVNKLNASGRQYAEAERDYKVALSKASLKLKTEGLAVTLIDKVVYGLQEVANTRFARDCAEASYKANLEVINMLKLQVRILHEQEKQDWGAAGRVEF